MKDDTKLKTEKLTLCMFVFSLFVSVEARTSCTDIYLVSCSDNVVKIRDSCYNTENFACTNKSSVTHPKHSFNSIGIYNYEYCTVTKGGKCFKFSNGCCLCLMGYQYIPLPTRTPLPTREPCSKHTCKTIEISIFPFISTLLVSV